MPPDKSLWQRLVLAFFRRLFLAEYRRGYLRSSALSSTEITRWGAIVAAIRLDDGIPEEHDLLVRIIRKHFAWSNFPTAAPQLLQL